MRPAIRCRRLSPPGRQARVHPMAMYTVPTLSFPRIRTVRGRSGSLAIPTALGKASARHCHWHRGAGLPFTLAAAHAHAALVELLCGNAAETFRLADRGLALATEHA